MAHSPYYNPLAVFPLTGPLFTYLAPSSCDRNCPPQSQVARKLTHLVPRWPLAPSPPKSQSPLGFPELNVHLIRATSQTLSSVYSTHMFNHIGQIIGEDRMDLLLATRYVQTFKCNTQKLIIT